MAKLALTQNNGTVIGSVSIPDAAIPLMRRRYEGGTNAETASNVLQALLTILRGEVKARLLQDRYAVDYAAVEPGRAAEGAAFETEWPVT